MFAKNPSLGEGTGPRGGTKECRYIKSPFKTIESCSRSLSLRYIHFQVVPTAQKSIQPIPTDWPLHVPTSVVERLLPKPTSDDVRDKGKGKAEWINCDIRSFDYSVLGQ
jgi:mRNA (2'-O-methyladenosine-N6-)-methyltransferase